MLFTGQKLGPFVTHCCAKVASLALKNPSPLQSPVTRGKANNVGVLVGAAVGEELGKAVVGAALLGSAVGLEEGAAVVGAAVGITVEGALLGTTVVGAMEGITVVGTLEGVVVTGAICNHNTNAIRSINK